MALISERKKFLNVKCVFQFSVQLLSETFLTLRGIERDIMNVLGSSCNLSLCPCQILMKPEFRGQIFKNIFKYQISCRVPCGRTDRHDEASGRWGLNFRDKFSKIYSNIRFHAEFHADGQTGMTKLVAALFFNANVSETASSGIHLLPNANSATCLLPATSCTGLYVSEESVCICSCWVCAVMT